jgi:hypothetical protein
MRSSPFWGQFDWISSDGIESEVFRPNQGILTRVGIESERNSLTGRIDCSDHYRAIPLSDGYHILFTDPETGNLCLGSDAPVGGPTKLLRKIWFSSPDTMSSPCSYAAGSDLSWGIRVVAAYSEGMEQSIWLYSIPIDIFMATEAIQPASASTWNRQNSKHNSQNTEWINWWPDDDRREWLGRMTTTVPGVLPRRVWPVRVRGQKIGTCRGLTDLAIDSGPNMTIWALSKRGVATVWKLDDGRYQGVKRRWILRDGTIRESHSDSEGEGNIEMHDTVSRANAIPDPPIPLQQPDSFDGATSFISSTAHTSRTNKCCRIQWSPHNVHYNSEEDACINDIPKARTVQHGELIEELIPARPRFDSRQSREGSLRRSYSSATIEFDSQLIGIARFDVEIC